MNRAEREDLIGQLLEQVGDVGGSRHERYLREILTTVLRLARDQASVGDLKIVTTALKEMRYAALLAAIRPVDPVPRTQVVPPFPAV